MAELNLDMYPKTLWNEAYTTELVTSRLIDKFENDLANNSRSRKKLVHPLADKRILFDALAACELLKQFLLSHGRYGRETRPGFLDDDEPFS